MLASVGVSDTDGVFLVDVRRQEFGEHWGYRNDPQAVVMELMNREIATPKECAAALHGLSDADLRRLDEAARLRVAGLASVEGRDLLHEAIARMLEGKRQWPRNVPLEAFLRETMRSIASDHWRRQKSARVVAESEARADPETGDGAIAMAGDASMAPEARTGAAETLARIDALFSNDADAQAVMAGKASGMSPREIQEEYAMNETRYATTLRRIRRGVAGLFEDGGEL